jgi:hypothetical protein
MGKSKTRRNRKACTKRAMTRSVYTEADYNSNDGMLTAVWGPSVWHMLHTMSFNYPVEPTDDDKLHYRNFILSLKYVLPCGKCRKNLRKNFKKLPLEMKDMASRDSFSRYIYNLHELVNTMLKKKSGLSYEVVRERYEHFRSRCTATSQIPLPIVEKGCVKPLYGEKSKCVLKIVPQQEKCESFEIDDKCVKRDLSTVF